MGSMLGSLITLVSECTGVTFTAYKVCTFFEPASLYLNLYFCAYLSFLDITMNTHV